MVAMTKDDVDSTRHDGADDDTVHDVESAASEAPALEEDRKERSEESLEKSSGKSSSADRAGTSWVSWAVGGLVAALLVAATAWSGYCGWQLWQERRVDTAAAQAQATAVDYAQILTSIDSNKIDENFSKVLNGATGEFKDMYTQSSVQLRQLLIDNKATAHSEVVESAIQSKSTNKVVVLLMVNQSITNSNRPDPRIDRSRMKITMEKIDGRWLASKVELP